MNYLAHFYLSGDNPAIAAGNFLADLLQNREVALLPEGIQQGVRLHRKIDTFTDNHVLVRQAIRRLHADHHKYAPVIVDVWYDYILATNWALYSPQPLQEFANGMYDAVLEFQEIIPARVLQQVQGMIRDNWLTKYASIDGIRDTFFRMSRYVSKPEWLDGAADRLVVERPVLETEFHVFFPELQRFVRAQRQG